MEPRRRTLSHDCQQSPPPLTRRFAQHASSRVQPPAGDASRKFYGRAMCACTIRMAGTACAAVIPGGRAWGD